MTWRRIITGLVVLALLGLGWVGYSFYVTWKGIPEAYAAWDAGTLVVEYLGIVVPLLFASGFGVAVSLCFKRWREYPTRPLLALGIAMFAGLAFSLYVLGLLVVWFFDPLANL